jgi:hypothetical protein
LVQDGDPELLEYVRRLAEEVLAVLAERKLAAS